MASCFAFMIFRLFLNIYVWVFISHARATVVVLRGNIYTMGLGFEHLILSWWHCLERVCHWRWSLRFYSLLLIPVGSLWFILAVWRHEHSVSCSCHHACSFLLCLPTRTGSFWSYKPYNYDLLPWVSFSHGILSQQK